MSNSDSGALHALKNGLFARERADRMHTAIVTIILAVAALLLGHYL
jgi:hypothetical protein